MSSKTYFNEIGEQWDSMRQSFFSDSVRVKAFLTANIKPGKMAADIGAGSGFITQGLLEDGLDVIAIDESDTMIDIMNKKFSTYTSFKSMIGESESIPLADSKVDYVFANMYLHHVENPLNAIQEMSRILKPEGKIIITDLDEHQYDILKKEHHDRWMGFNRDDIKTWFSKADLKNISVDCANELCQCEMDKISISIFIAIGTKL